MNLPFKKILKKLLKIGKETNKHEDQTNSYSKSDLKEEVSPSHGEADLSSLESDSHEDDIEKEKIEDKSELSEKQLANHFLGKGAQENLSSEADEKESYYEDEDTDEDIALDPDGEYFRSNFDKYLSGADKSETVEASYRNQRSKKRKSKPGATLDLHGKTSAVAITRLKSFFESSRRRNISTVLVITGKGIHSPDGKSVLRDAVESWLNSKGQKMITGYKSAPAKLGGSGALIINLKK